MKGEDLKKKKIIFQIFEKRTKICQVFWTLRVCFSQKRPTMLKTTLQRHKSTWQ
jgi:hypothetical protein